MSKEWKSPKRGANILCRIKNPSPQNVVELVRILPKRVMPKDEFATIISKVDDKWFQNTHQAAEQWGLYYVDNDNYYPRFTKDIDADEAEAYLRYWIKKYPLINPYSRFSKSDGRGLVLSIAEYLENHPRRTRPQDNHNRPARSRRTCGCQRYRGKRNQQLFCDTRHNNRKGCKRAV